MNWDAIGAIGEIGGAVGVVISLVYLASQIRNQNVESQVNAVNNLTYQWNEFMGAMAENSELVRIWDKGHRDFEGLTPVELVQYSTHLNRIFRICEGMYHQHEAGRLGNRVWRGVENSISDLCSVPGVKQWWPTRAHWYSKDLGAFISPLIARVEAPRIVYTEYKDGPAA